MTMHSGKRRDTNPNRRRRVMLSVRLFGELEVRRDDGRSMPVGSPRVVSLLAYLLVHRAAQPRKRLAFLLWPDSTESQARTNLRHLLHELKRSVPDIDRFIALDTHALHWKPETLGRVDLDEFEDALTRAEAVTGTFDLVALRQAVDLYTGDLLEGLEDEWIVPDRDRLRQRLGDALERVAVRLSERADYAEAIRHAERLLHHDPLREDTYRLLMRLHESQGARVRALGVYHTCVATLSRDLGVTPSISTRRAYEALIANDLRDKSAEDTVAESGAPQLIGRTEELARLRSAWLASERGAAQLLVVSGEAGVGKTRLVEELRSWCQRRGAGTAEARAYAAEGALAYSPVVSWLRAETFRDRLTQHDTHRRALGRLLPELLDASNRRSREGTTDGEARQWLFDAVAGVALRSASPTLLIADDLQWFDRDSLQIIHYLIRVDPTARVLIVATLRKEDALWSQDVMTLIAAAKGLGRYGEIQLDRLNEADTAALAAHLERRVALAPNERQQLYRETEGNPLFIVEAVRAGWRSGGAGWTTPKVQGVIESRLANLSEPARDALTTAAAIGREFTTEVLTRASDVSGQTFVSALDELWRRGLIRERGAHGYDFSHDKIREVTYLGASPVRRRHDHLRIAGALEELHALNPRAVTGIIATHYESAGATDSAITWYERAAAVALELGANADALRIVERALGAIDRQPHDIERDRRELAIRATLVSLLGSFEGYGSSRLADAQRRSIALAQVRGLELSPPLLRSLAVTSLARGDFMSARDVGGQLLTRATQGRDQVLLVEAEYVLGIASFWQGDLAEARQHFEQAVAQYSADHRVRHLVDYGQDPKVICLSRLANTLWFLGEFDDAWRSAETALAIAKEIGHLHTRATALMFATLLGIEARDDDRVRVFAADISGAMHQHESIQSRIGANAIAGFVDVLDGRVDSGIARVRSAISELRGAVHAPGMHVALARILLEACVRANANRTGAEAADSALASAGSVQVFEAEIRRLRAHFLAARGAPLDDIMTELTRAETVARGQGAVAFEVRIALDFLRYGRRSRDAAMTDAARRQLAELLSSRPHWGSSPDILEATALLTT
jgi:DNA-binding SARP family transcriptional activator